MEFGSSPLARGAQLAAILVSETARLIPAGAGSTWWGSFLRFYVSAHPRWRGEHIIGGIATAVAGGSSPLARGALLVVCLIGLVRRLIPAGAGSTDSQMKIALSDPAHPRWRGEHSNRSANAFDMPGSSPLARGAHILQLLELRGQRLIPAGAGSTQREPRPVDEAPAHPRWRGEHMIWLRCPMMGSGSSPLARGALWVVIWGFLSFRLIPAGAGSTLSELWFVEPLSRFYFNLFLSPEARGKQNSD